MLGAPAGAVRSFVAYSPVVPAGQVCTEARHVFGFVKAQSLLTDAEGRLLPRRNTPVAEDRCRCGEVAWGEQP